MKFRIVFLATLLSCGSAHALNVRDALMSAYKNNQDLLATRQDVLAKHEAIVQAKAGFRPTIQASAGSSISKSRTRHYGGAPTYKGLDKRQEGAVKLQQNLFKGFSDIAKVSQTEHDIAGLWAQLKDKEQQLFLQVIKAYLDLYAKYAAVEVYNANLTVTRQNYESAQTKKDIGEETRTQEALAEGKYLEAEAKLQLAKAELEAAKATYTQLTGEQAPEKVDRPKEIVDVPSSVETLQDLALRENPKIKQALEEISSAKQSKKAATGGLLPSVDLTASTSKFFNNNKTNVNNIDITTRPSETQFNNQVGLNLTIPLYDAGSTRSQRRQASETVIAKRINFENVKQQIVQACVQAYRTFVACKINMENSSKQVEAQQVALDGTTQEMQVGTKILLDVLNAQAQLLQAKLDQINTVQQYYLYMYQMLLLQGQLTAEGLQLPVEIFRPEKNYEEIKNHI